MFQIHRSTEGAREVFLDNLLLWLHIAGAVFCVGPVTAATSFTPRYIRQGDISVVRFLLRMTRIFGLLTLIVFATGLALGRKDLGAPWVTVSMTLFIVAFALLFAMVQRDQRNAVKRMEAEQDEAATALEAESAATAVADGSGAEEAPAEKTKAKPQKQAQIGRIAGFSGVIALLWLVILVFMIWQPGA